MRSRATTVFSIFFYVCIAIPFPDIKLLRLVRWRMAPAADDGPQFATEGSHLPERGTNPLL
jgi:hypothetical protein